MLKITQSLQKNIIFSAGSSVSMFLYDICSVFTKISILFGPFSEIPPSVVQLSEFAETIEV